MAAMPAVTIAVIGPGDPGVDPRLLQIAETVGAQLAAAQATVVCGGLGGVMEAAARGAAQAGGTVIGLLPGPDRSAANPWITHAIPTGLGEARNVLIARAADAVVAVGGAYGTLSEIAMALKLGRAVIGIETWEMRRDAAVDAGIVPAPNPTEAVRLALAAARPH